MSHSHQAKEGARDIAPIKRIRTMKLDACCPHCATQATDALVVVSAANEFVCGSCGHVAPLTSCLTAAGIAALFSLAGREPAG